MKNNVIYINFSYQYKKKSFLALLKKIFKRSAAKPVLKDTSREVIRIEDFDKKSGKAASYKLLNFIKPLTSTNN